MAKQPSKQPAPQPKKPAPKTGGFNSGTYLLRNFIMVAVLAFILFGIDKMNEKNGQFNDLYNEFMQLRQRHGDPQRMEELRNQLIEIQNDTSSYFKKLTRGYYWAVHTVAIGETKNIEEMKEKAGKPITREDKLAQRVGIWPFIDYINKNTPPNAVIYLPFGDSAISNNGKWNYIYDPEWMEYFLYPRLCVTIGNEQAHPDLAKRVTHVLIIEGKGYEKLKYDVPVEQRAKEAVLPIDHPPVPVQNKK